jgi:diguanylate cyclase (GGDEF)-like protein
MRQCVFLWGDHHELRRALAEANERLAGLEAKLAGRSRIDPRTGLLTVAAFHGDAEAVLAHAATAEQPASLALVDIDDFRSLNARRGTAAGDSALLTVAGRLRALTRTSDVLGRTGADELAVLMPGTTLAGARACCDRLIEELRSLDIPNAGIVTVSASVIAHEPGMTIEALLADAAAGLERANAHVIDALAAALAERDSYTGEHSASVVESATSVARALGLHELEVERVSHAALLHDIGKVGVPDRILNKPSALTPEELAEMRKHPVHGRDVILKAEQLAGVRDDTILTLAKDIVYTHHERWDGTGYPEGLKGTDIPIPGRVMALVDVYDAAVTRNVYRQARSHDDTVNFIVSCKGTHFDPAVVDAFVGVAGDFEKVFHEDEAQRHLTGGS